MVQTQPNILFIMSDDHASHAMSCYGSQINETPNLDRIANEGLRFDNCFCTNSICAPSRAAILTGQYNHMNGVRTLGDDLDGLSRMYKKSYRKMAIKLQSWGNGISDMAVTMIQPGSTIGMFCLTKVSIIIRP